MRIIGGRDYFDGAGGGVDPGITFLREEKEITASPFEIPHPIRIPRGKSEIRMRPVLAIVAGACFPVIRLRHRAAHQEVYQTTGHLLDLESAIDYHQTQSEIKKKSFSFGWLRQDPEAVLREFFSLAGRDATSWCLDHRIVTALIRRARDDHSRNPAAATYQGKANGDFLKEVELFRTLPPPEAHMKIAGYLGGVMPHSREIVELTDGDRISKAGFDPKASFRKDQHQSARKQKKSAAR